MKSLYDYLRAANPDGIPEGDAVQLFLWIFSTKDFLPPALQKLELSKEVLVDTFGRLSRDGVVTRMNSEEVCPPWESLVREFLLGNRMREGDFVARADRYLRMRR